MNSSYSSEQLESNTPMRKTIKNKKGFTLLELLFVVLIIGIIMTVIVIAISRSAKEKAEVARGLKFADSVRAQLSGAPIAWWKFDEGGGIDAKDSWGGNHGTIIGDVTRVKGVGRGEALEFNGGHVDIPGDPSLRVTNKLTLELWVKPDGTQSSSVTFISKNGTASGNSWMLHRHGSGSNYRVMLLIWGDTNNKNIIMDDSLTSKKWTHIIGVYDGVAGTMKIYFNGVEKKSYMGIDVPTSIKITSDGIRIGEKLNNSNPKPFYGDMDEVRIYGEALTAQEIQQRYVESAPRHGIALK